MGNFVSEIVQFFRNDIWRMRLDDLPLKKAIYIKPLRILIIAIRGFDKDKCLMRSSALTFYTVLSIPSVMAMLFGIAKGFGFEKRLEERLYENFPGQEF